MPETEQILDETQDTGADAIEASARMAQMMEQEAQGKSDEVETVDEKPAPEPAGEPAEPPATTIAEPDGKLATEPPATQEEPSGTPPKETVEPPKPGDAPKEEDDDETLALEKRLESIRLKDSAKPATKKALTEVKNITKRVHGQYREQKSKVKELETKLAEREALQVLDEPTRQELDELRNFRKTTAIEQDPAFNEKYAKKIESLDQSALQSLADESLPTDRRLPKSTAEFIQSNGGVTRFRSSQNFMPTGLKDREGNPIAVHEDGTPFTHMEFWNEYIEKKLTAAQRDMVNDVGMESRRLMRERQEEINKARADVEGWEKDRGEKQALQQQEFNDRFKKRAEDYTPSFGDVAKKKEIPTSATKEEKDAIDKHNSRVDRAEGIAKKYGSQLTPESYAEMVLNSAYVETMREINKDLETDLAQEKKRADEAEQKINAIKKAGQTSNRQSAPMHASQATSIDEESDPEKRMQRRMEGK